MFILFFCQIFVVNVQQLNQEEVKPKTSAKKWINEDRFTITFSIFLCEFSSLISATESYVISNHFMNRIIIIDLKLILFNDVY